MKKRLNYFDLIVVAFGAMIGWGWVVSTGNWIQTGGVIGTIIGFVVAGIMIFFVGLVYSELTSAMPVTGGERVFSLKAFGPTGSFVCTWFLILSYIGVVCYEAVSLPTILQYVFPSIGNNILYSVAGFDVSLWWLLISIFFSVFIGILNIIGIKKAAVFQKILTVFIALVGAILVVTSIIKGNNSITNTAFSSNDVSTNVFGILKIVSVAPFFLFGFDVIPQTAGEINVPHKKIGRVMLLSIILAVLFYCGVAFSVGRIFNFEEINNSIQSSGLVTADAMEKAFNNRTMAIVLILGGLCGIVTSWNSFLIGGSRAIYSMADANLIPGRFKRLHKKYDSPYLAIILVTIISIGASFFGKNVLVWIVDAATFACSIAYFIVSFSFLILRRKEPNMNRPFKVKHPKIVGILAIVLSLSIVLLYLIPGTGTSLTWQEWIIVGIWTLTGFIFYLVSKFKNKTKFGYSLSDDC